MASTEISDVTEYVFIKQYEDVNEYPLTDSFPFLACLVAAYLLFVLKIGPAFMKNREPYELKNTILVYNAIQVALSAYFFYLASIPIIMVGLVPRRCAEEDPAVRKVMARAVFIYLLGKISELLDTVFFVLRKKYNQVTFLHVYHHSSVVLASWMMFKYSMSQTSVYAGWINSLVHVVMYFYYFMAALGPQYQKYLTWKKHITTFQLTQFVTVILHQIASLIFTSGKHSILGACFMLYTSIMFYALFYNFYKKSYTQPKKTAKNGSVNGSAVDEVKAQNGISNGTNPKAKSQ